MADQPTPTIAERIDRRSFMGFLAGLGVGGTTFPAALWALVQDQQAVTTDTIACAEDISGLAFTDAERDLMLESVNENLQAFRRLRDVPIGNEVPPALRFDPVLPGRRPDTDPRAVQLPETAGVRRPAELEQVAFWPITHLAALIRTRQVTSVELTKMYLDRMRRYGPRLECLVTLTDELAMQQAQRADADIAAGRYRGPLHGIPWGAKDLLAEDAYRTTWGATPFQDQVLAYDATVVQRLEDAGAVLIAKLTLGALAWGDVWFGGKTRNPWKLDQGSSGSSAGSASATVAGLVGFSIGSETLGSIVSPSTRCGATGLRPTFGRVSRHGAMALSWSMDKLGPICRTVEDCALVFAAIHGADGKDPTARTLPFGWNPSASPRDLRVGYYASAFASEDASDDDRASLAALQDLGIDPIPVELPTEFPVDAMGFILGVEAAAAFDELTRSNRDDLLVRQVARAWPNEFRQARLVPAVEYVQANRMRSMLMEAMETAMADVDVFITPSYGGSVLLTTNLTGHPAVTLPNGFNDDGTPVSISFIGRLFGEEALMTLAHAVQTATGFHLRRPPEFAVSSR
jgi:Asp-tRNA(Asn)/Glu-tRNA(Gln) amidotransferase A subunit family amidase